MRLHFILLILIGIGIQSSLTGTLSPESELETLAKSPYWLRLIHYEKSFWGGYRSRVEGGEFFFSPEGKSNPYLEMQATLAAMSKDIEVGRLKQHPQCAFPERYRFLKEGLKLKTKDVLCSKLNEYLDKLNPESVTLVFSSAYPHNPGSMFGHTFLRINSKSKNQKKQDLLDWGISYAAQVENDENGFAFVYLGLTGGYRGQFSLLPYYAKVNEYVNNESRDVWEYELNLNREETYRLIRNVWEVETNSFFDYYFLDENCSYQLLAFLEVAKPDWELTDFPIYVIPGETIKKVSAISGAIKNIKYRPSLQKKMMGNYEKLERSQKNSFQNIIAYKTTPQEVSDIEVLDEVSDYLLYVKKKKENELNESEKKLFRQVLVQRSTLGKSNQENDSMGNLMDSSRPDLAHNTYRLGLSSGVEHRQHPFLETQFFQDIQFKFAFHDLLNSDLGYTPFSQVDFPAVTLRYYLKSYQLRFENIHILSLTSLSPLADLDKHPSWTFHLEVLSPKDLSCNHCQVFHFDLGGGGAIGVGKNKAIFYSLGVAQIEAGNSFRLRYRVIPKWQMGSIIYLFEKYKIQLQSSWLWDLFQRERRAQFFEFQLNQSLALSQIWELRFMTQAVISSQENSSFYEGKFSLNYYF